MDLFYYQQTGDRAGYSLNTDYVKVPIFPDFSDNFARSLYRMLKRP